VKKYFSRKDAKAQRKSGENAAALGVFAPLREKYFLRIKFFLGKAIFETTHMDWSRI
jgi:hypothetical protein